MGDQKRRYTMQERENALFRSGLAVMIERAGGVLEYTQTEFATVKARHGEYVLRGEIETSGHDEPIIRISIAPDAEKGSMPTN